jgi:tripartite-type tricarboxylate transporter receptor subunit TctC
VTDAIGGQIQGVIGTVLLVLSQVRAGSLRPLAITSKTRSELLPDVPAMAEFLPGYEASQWIGIGAPKDTPAAVITKLNAEINAALADPATRKRLIELGCAISAGSPADFEKFIADETAKWAKVIAFAGIKAD